MNQLRSALTVMLTLVLVAYAPAAPALDSIAARGGAIHIMPVFHASFEIEYRGKVIAVDPVSAGTYSDKADLVLITHAHPDHLDVAGIKQATTPTARVVAPRAITQQVGQALKPHPMLSLANGSTLGLLLPRAGGDSVRVTIRAVPMYNLVRGPRPGQKYHPRGLGNGYVVTLGGKRLYIAGDTEVTPSMRSLRDINVAFLPMNLPYTMTPQEAAAGARTFKPKIVYPYHYRYPFNQPNENPQQFANALKGSGIEVRIRDWYPADAVARVKD